jgi:hypothetical protein
LLSVLTTFTAGLSNFVVRTDTKTDDHGQN